MSALIDQLNTYLRVREHTLSTAKLAYPLNLLAEADYVIGEAEELKEAVTELFVYLSRHLAAGTKPDYAATLTLLAHVRAEVSDVLISTTALCTMIPGGVSPEECIVYKTNLDEGRG